MCNFFIAKQKRNCKFAGKEQYNGFCTRHRAHAKPVEEKSCSHSSESKSEHEECCICLCDIKKKKEFVKTKCGHIYHKYCIETWTKRNDTCPMCRAENPLNVRRSRRIREQRRQEEIIEIMQQIPYVPYIQQQEEIIPQPNFINHLRNIDFGAMNRWDAEALMEYLRN